MSEGDQPASESVHNAGDVLSKLLLALDIALAGDHDALGLGRTGAVHGLGAVADSGCAQAQVLDEPQDPLTVLCAHTLPGGEELVADLADGLAVAAHHRVGVKVRLRGHGDHQAAGNVLCQTHDLIGEAGDVLLADVGQQQVDLIVARLRPEALRGAGDAAAVQRLVQVDHLDQLVLHRAGLLHAVVLGNQGSGTDQGVAYADLAAAVALPVVAGKALHHHAGELILAVEEDVLVGDEHVVQHHQGLLAAELRVAHVDGRVLLQLPGIAAQNLMGKGIGFGPEGDYKISALSAVLMKMSEGKEGATGFIEDYTYDLTPGQELELASHMLEVPPAFAATKPEIDVIPLGIGGKEDPARLIFDGVTGDGIQVTMVDMGDHFRIICADIELVKQPKPMPKLPVARIMYRHKPNFQIGTAAWCYAGGAHHSVVSTALTRDDIAMFARLTGTELITIGEDTTEADLQKFFMK